MALKKLEQKETLYVRIKKSNKKFLERQAKILGFRSVAQYLDARIDSWKNITKKKR